MGLVSPGVGVYSPGIGTFEKIKLKGGYDFGMGLSNLNGGTETFGKANRFGSPKKSLGY
jgi:hypothetical protein|tara:strand:- start:890 stop:1066 length:177 start_codon:yes stop_codon:yes gene_type:complete